MPQDNDCSVMMEDIRRDQFGISLLDELHTGLRPQDGGEKSMPTLLLYDEQGLKLFEEITYLDEYYLTNAEIELLQRHATEIATLIPKDCDILELGSGNLRKVKILLDALEVAKKRVNYYALDLSKPELKRTLSVVPKHYQYVRCHGLLGTYDDALEWLQRPDKQRRPKWILTLGSSIGNFGRQEAAAFLHGFANTLGSNDRILVGLDACQDENKVYPAYNDRHGKTHEFIMNGLVHANRLLDKDVFKLEDWKVIGEYNEPAGRHQAFYAPIKDLVIDGVYIEAGERIRVEESHKYSSIQSSELWQAIGLVQQASFGNNFNDYRQGPTSPKFYQTIFERGIDPDVDDPEHCHAHSEIPDTWPPVTEIVHYQARVRSRVGDLFSNGDEALPGDVGRALWLGFEHEGEDMPDLFIGRRSDWIVPPPGRVPSFETLAQEAEQTTVSNQWIKIPATAIFVGIDSPDNEHGLAHHFGWDNEKPMRRVHVPAFEAKARPLTNEDFARYLCETNRATLPASWTRTSSGKGDIKNANVRIGSSDTPGPNGPAKPLVEAFLDGKFVRTVYGPVPLQYALAWPVFASYDELAGCAKWMDGRIPTAEEVRSIYSHVDLAKKREAEKVQARKISAVNGHLSNDGVEESPPSAPAVNGSSSVRTCPTPKDLFVDLEGCNVGFSSFCPKPVTHLGNKLCGQGDLGGVWEWTSSTLEEYEGFEAMPSYPGYTADFFDGKHNVVLGGSWATHPRIAGRKSFIALQVGKEQRLGWGTPIHSGSSSTNHGTDHKCGICKTVLSSPRAKKTCFGVHEEVCPKYHFTLFYVGNSNKCDACRKSTELHDKRHREIASLILKIESLAENEKAILSPVPNERRKPRKSGVLELEYFRESQALERIGEEDEWADTSTLNDDDLDLKRPGLLGENFIPGRTTKAERKQARHSSLLKVVKPALMDRIHAALHPQSDPLEGKSNKSGDSNNSALAHKIIEDNISFNNNCFKPGSMRQSVHAKKLLKSNCISKTPSKVAQDEIGITAILEELGIAPSPVRASKEHATLLRQLRSVIRDDIDKVGNENRDTMMRMAGYWRYVNRKTYNFMARNNQIWDWVTGQRLEEIEEEEESELNTEDDHEVESLLWDDASTVGTPRSGAGTPQKEVEDYTSDFQFDSTDARRVIEKNEEQGTKLNSPSQWQQNSGKPQTPAPEACQFTARAVEYGSKVPRLQGIQATPTSPFIPSGKDLRHYEIPATIATHKHAERLPSKPPILIQSTSQSSSNNYETFSAPHCDPNNHYDSLENLKGSPNQRLGRANSVKVLKVALPRDSPSKEATGPWITVKRKKSDQGKTTYAGALKKHT
ncbi:MAG: hypothetical protein Q9172_006115 [Xanthocarpia lactea]